MSMAKSVLKLVEEPKSTVKDKKAALAELELQRSLLKDADRLFINIGRSLIKTEDNGWHGEFFGYDSIQKYCVGELGLTQGQGPLYMRFAVMDELFDGQLSDADYKLLGSQKLRLLMGSGLEPHVLLSFAHTYKGKKCTVTQLRDLLLDSTDDGDTTFHIHRNDTNYVTKALEAWDVIYPEQANLKKGKKLAGICEYFYKVVKRVRWDPTALGTPARPSIN